MPYGRAQQQRRHQLLPNAYGTPCPRCGQTMHSWQALDLGHTHDLAQGGPPIGDRIEHATCNRTAGAQLKNHIHHGTPLPTTNPSTIDW